MKKIIIILFIITLIMISMKKDSEIIIPNNAIRFRVIANSNTLEDQQEKLVIKDSIEKKVYSLISDANNTDEARYLLEDNMESIKQIVDSYKIPYELSYGYNYFPTKNYKGIMYKAGNYESLVIKLGEGMGQNFWCVLFPPLCLLESDKEDTSDIEYQFYVKKILEKF